MRRMLMVAMVVVALMATSCGTTSEATTGTTAATNDATSATISTSFAATTTLATTPVAPSIDPRRPALERLEAASDLLAIGTVEAVGPVAANTVDGRVPLLSRAALDRTVPLTNVDLRVDAILGRRASAGLVPPLEVGEVVHVALRQGRLDFTTTAADRARLGMRSVNDDIPGKPVETLGELMLSISSSDDVQLKVGTRYVLYLFAEHLPSADRPDEMIPILTVTSTILGVLTMVEDAPTTMTQPGPAPTPARAAAGLLARHPP